MYKFDQFTALANALCVSGCDTPTLVLDRDRLDHNLEVLAGLGLPALRLVVKSLPSLPLLEHCMAVLGTRRLMAFHRPFLEQVLAQYDDVDVLMGKPLPTAAVERVVGSVPPGRLSQVQWLVDGMPRLQQLLALARARHISLRVSIEINVGMQRGGVDEPAELAHLEQAIRAAPDHLQLSGLMGYDAHAARAARPLATVAGAIARSQERYRDFCRVLSHDIDTLVLNGAGSPTHIRHLRNSPLNDISLGSVLVKPTDFDLPDLAAYREALWIAAPVLKRRRGVAIPFLDRLSLPLSKVGPWARDSVFLYGGRWMAQPAWPPGMRTSRLYGLSSNQQLMTLPAHRDLGPGRLGLPATHPV